MEFKHIASHDGDADGETEGNDDNPANPDPLIWSEVSYYSWTLDFSWAFLLIFFGWSILNLI